jgi:hypothetical protein
VGLGYFGLVVAAPHRLLGIVTVEIVAPGGVVVQVFRVCPL